MNSRIPRAMFNIKMNIHSERNFCVALDLANQKRFLPVVRDIVDLLCKNENIT
jgi:hypothetical protein